MKKNYTQLNIKRRVFAFLSLAVLAPAFYYAQQTYTFTTCGATGPIGPTQAQVNAAYGVGNSLNGQVVVTAGIQTWTVPQSGLYRITANGASAGMSTNGSANFIGRGASMQGEFNLTAGEVLHILVGQKGVNNTYAAGGGGGSFVTRAPHNTINSILVIAGGGGSPSADRGGISASTGTCGTFDANGSGPATCNGDGGITFTGNSGGGGGGFFTNGASNTYGFGGFAYVNGGQGANTAALPLGGFGGGGSHNASGTTACGHGGGGFSGGNGGNRNGTGSLREGGGGGGSYNNGTNQVNSVLTTTGDGIVVIEQMSLPCTASIETPTITTANAVNNGVCLHAGQTATLEPNFGNSSYVGVNYNWFASSSSSGPFSPVGTSTNPSYVTPGVGATAVYYMVEVTCISAGVTVASGAFGVLPNPTLALSSVPAINFTLSSLSVCTNDHYTITASGASTYTWNNGAGQAANVNPYVLTPVAAFPDYTVTGTSAEGCTDTNTMTIATILDAPIIFLNATANNICEGGNVMLTVTGNAYMFSWAPNISSGSPIITVAPTSSTEYTVTAAAVNGCSQTATQMINVNAPPVISVITSTTPGQTPCVGEEINMAASGATTYTWLSNGGFFQGPTIIVTPEESTTYYVNGTDQNGCTGTTIFNLVVDACLGIAELNSNEGVSVYPNPNNGEFVVELNNGSVKSIDLYDLTGRVVLSNRASDNKVNININHLSNGVYYLKVKSDNATKMVKVVKQ